MNAAATLADLRAGRLHGATALDLRHAGLTELPPEVLGLADTLQSLDVSGNALRFLPDELPRMRALRVLFASDNRFETLPPVLGRCEALDIVGFKANAIAQVPAEAVAPSLRWLILTDNRVEALPESLGRCARLQKLMLAGNRLRALPASLAACTRLELVRLAANRFESPRDALPEGLLALPHLAWIAFAGNPFCEAQEQAAAAVADIAWAELEIGALLGEGASGHIHAARWRAPDGTTRELAVKKFKGAITSDGLPRSEMAASIAAGRHPHIVAVEGRLVGHPAKAAGLLLQRIPAGFRNLAGPPSLASCTRDVYDPGLRLSEARARAIALGASAALAHLHARGLAHGDFYAHNLLADDLGHALMGDFGAASFLPQDPALAEAVRRMDRRALRVLVDELAARCDRPDALDDLRSAD